MKAACDKCTAERPLRFAAGQFVCQPCFVQLVKEARHHGASVAVQFAAERQNALEKSLAPEETE